MKYPLLALLARGPAHGYELKLVFESQFGAVSPSLNIGQVYTTLGRLERDGLVESLEVNQAGRPTKNVYSLTDKGRSALAEWIREPSPSPHLRDEFFMKLTLSGLTGIADPQDLLERQRSEFLDSLRGLNELSLRRNEGVVTELLIEGAALHIEADLKWLDRCEERLSELERLDAEFLAGGGNERHS